MKHNDRIVMAGEMMLLKVPSNGEGKAEGEGDDDELSPEQIAKEYNEGKMEVSGTEEMKQMLKMKKQWEAEREKMREQMAQMDVAGQQKMREQMEKEAAQRQEQANRQQMLELIPLVDEANKLLGLLNRPMLKASAMCGSPSRKTDRSRRRR